MSELDEKLRQLEDKLDKIDKKLEKMDKATKNTYYYGLIMGLLLGSIGNFMVSYIAKVLEILNIPPLGWVSGAILSYVAVFGLIWLLIKESKKS